MLRRGCSFILAAVLLIPLFALFPPETGAEDSPIFAAPEDTDVIVYAAAATESSINLTNETIDLRSGFTVAAYSLDGGTKWKQGALPSGAKLTKLFDKGLTLSLTDQYDKKEKGPASGANQIQFPAINARPKANAEKLKPYYLRDQWVLSKDGTEASVFAGYEYAETTDKKTAKDGLWQPVAPEGFAVKSGKTKVTYLVRTVPSGEGGYTPRSRQFKVTPANYGKQTNYKYNYKKETVKVKKGDFYTIDGENWVEVLEDRPDPLDLEAILTFGEVLTIHRGATGKKPRTEDQTIIPLRRLIMEGTENPEDPDGPEIIVLSCAKGKIQTNLKKYEVFNPDKNKWGGVPKVKGSAEFPIRLKTTAKGTSGKAASVNGTLVIKYGEYTAGKKTKSGVTEAWIIVPPVPVILTPPEGFTVTEGESAPMSVAAKGEPPLTYRWYLCSDEKKSNRILMQETDTNAKENVFNIPDTLEPGVYHFFVKIINRLGYDESEIVTVTVRSVLEPFEPLRINKPEYNQSVPTQPGDTPFFTVESWGINVSSANYPEKHTSDIILTMTLSALDDYRFNGLTAANCEDVLGEEIFNGTKSIIASFNVDRTTLTLTVTYNGDLRKVIPDLSALTVIGTPPPGLFVLLNSYFGVNGSEFTIGSGDWGFGSTDLIYIRTAELILNAAAGYKFDPAIAYELPFVNHDIRHRSAQTEEQLRFDIGYRS